jgi:YHS domain-containing protein
MVGWIIRAILFLIVLRLVLRFIQGLIQGLAPGSGASGGSRGPGPAEQLVRDPVCGTYVPRTRALTIGSGTAVRYFCSERCREAYGKHA